MKIPEVTIELSKHWEPRTGQDQASGTTRQAGDFLLSYQVFKYKYTVKTEIYNGKDQIVLYICLRSIHHVWFTAAV